MMLLIRKNIVNGFYIASFLFLLTQILFAAEVSTVAGEFDTADNDNGGEALSSFDSSDIDITVAGAINLSGHPAEASLRSRPLSSDLVFTYGSDGQNWTSAPKNYEGKYLGFYVYNASGSAGTLTITITEEDTCDALTCTHAPCVPQIETWTWGTPTNISWTNNWGYIVIGINDTDFSSSGGDGILNTINTNKATDTVTTIKGVTEFRFAQNAGDDLYIDRIVICDDLSDIAIDDQKMFPNLISSTTVNLDNMLPTISVGLKKPGADTPDDSSGASSIYLVEATAQSTPLGTSRGTLSTDVSLFLTPTSDLSAGTNYIMFVRPVDTAGDVGTCQIYNFTITVSGPSIPSTSFQRELTN